MQEVEEQKGQQTLIHKFESKIVEPMTADATNTEYENAYWNMGVFNDHCFSLKYVDLLNN